MADKTPIEWTKLPWVESGATWNPIRAKNLETGGIGHFCIHASAECKFCYSERTQRRFKSPVRFAAQDADKVEIYLDPRTLLAPLRWRAPRGIFVCSMTDLFLDLVPDEWIDQVFAVMALCPQHTFMVLTKRAERMRGYLTAPDLIERLARAIDRVDSLHESKGEATYEATSAVVQWNIDRNHPDLPARAQATYGLRGGAELKPWPLPNVWLGVSCGEQKTAEDRIPHLIETPAARKFLSCEPLLGPINLRALDINGDAEMDALDLLSDADLWRSDWDPAQTGTSIEEAIEGFQDEGFVYPPSEKKPHGIDWVIVGGESGRGNPDIRPMHPDWARSLRDQCQVAGVPFFFKQWGESLPVDQTLPGCGKVHGATGVKPGRMKLHYGGTPKRAPQHAYADRGVEFGSFADGLLTFRVGKKAAGRLLDGVEHNAFPVQAGAA